LTTPSAAPSGAGRGTVYTTTTVSGQVWSVRDYGDELTAHRGPDLLAPNARKDSSP